jgi:hypothetical protein
VFTAQTPAFTTGDGHCSLADFNRDGRFDIISPDGKGQAFISFGLPGGKFDTRSQVDVPGVFPVDFDFGDVNGDGFTDVVLANGNLGTNTIEVLIGQTGGSFVRSGAIPVGKKVVRFALATLDTGSTLDLAVVTERPAEFPPAGSTNQLQVLLGDANGGFLAQTPIPLLDRPSDVLAGDLNGDGLNDRS